MPARAAHGSSDPFAQLALQAVPTLLWIARPDRRFEWFSAAAGAFTGRSAPELCDDGWAALIHAEDQERYHGIVSASYDARCPFTLDYRIRNGAHAYRWVLDSAVPRFESDGGFSGYAGTIVDIEQRRALEERLAERTRALRLSERRHGLFLGRMAHDLRNPLAPIANTANVLRSIEDQDPLLPRLREVLERQVTRLDDLVSEIVEVTRFISGDLALVSESVSVGLIVRDAIATCAEATRSAGHSVELSLPVDRLFVRGDTKCLAQAVEALISNAAQFTPEPSTLTVSADARDGRARIRVTDPGEGISPAFLPHVFELYSREDRLRQRNPKGYGVGLALARRIVRLHCGDIEVFSAGPGLGTSFELSLPLESNAGDERSPAGGASDAQRASSSSDGIDTGSSSDEYSFRRL